jgi:hypothetical protein
METKVSGSCSSGTVANEVCYRALDGHLYPYVMSRVNWLAPTTI